MSNTSLLERLADSLYQAEFSRVPIGPLTEVAPNLTVDEAYRVQQINAERQLKDGRKLVGHKIGLTAKAMQELFNVNEPDYGHLFDTMIHDPSAPLDLSELIDPQIEVEPAFVLSKRLSGPGIEISDVLDATEYVTVCFEIIDSRVIDWRIKLQDTVADNGSSARVVMGIEKIDPGSLALDNLESVMKLDGIVSETGNTRAILGHPANGVAWLGNSISRFGLALEPGHIVLPGTCTRSTRIAGHSRVTGSIEGLGEVALDLKNAPTISKQ